MIYCDSHCKLFYKRLFAMMKCAAVTVTLGYLLQDRPSDSWKDVTRWLVLILNDPANMKPIHSTKVQFPPPSFLHTHTYILKPNLGHPTLDESILH